MQLWWWRPNQRDMRQKRYRVNRPGERGRGPWGQHSRSVMPCGGSRPGPLSLLRVAILGRYRGWAGFYATYLRSTTVHTIKEGAGRRTVYKGDSLKVYKQQIFKWQNGTTKLRNLPSCEFAVSSLLPGLLIGSSLVFSFDSYIFLITEVGVKDGESCRREANWQYNSRKQAVTASRGHLTEARICS